jgi:hypothetical protein
MESTISAVNTIPKRCAHPDCKRKLKLTDCDCRCGKRYCDSHRVAEDHNCQYDYKGHGMAALEKQLVRVQADRLERI